MSKSNLVNYIQIAMNSGETFGNRAEYPGSMKAKAVIYRGNERNIEDPPPTVSLGESHIVKIEIVTELSPENAAQLVRLLTENGVPVTETQYLPA